MQPERYIKYMIVWLGVVLNQTAPTSLIFDNHSENAKTQIILLQLHIILCFLDKPVIGLCCRWLCLCWSAAVLGLNSVRELIASQDPPQGLRCCFAVNICWPFSGFPACHLYAELLLTQPLVCGLSKVAVKITSWTVCACTGLCPFGLD